ncbi:MAG: isochorismatase family protein [Myxococcota bacterium]|nr:isochorismatase family protein [Myxococcota bacterium]
MDTLEARLPISLDAIQLGDGPVGLVIVDAGVGFTREGPLSDAARMVPMVKRIDAEWRALHAALGDRLHTLCFLDTHEPDIPEPPYPPHCIKGTGEDAIDPALEWLLDAPQVTVIRKDCINGFVGAIDRETGRNTFCDWVCDHEIHTLLVCGDCTDICVSDFVVTTLSARNHGLLTRVHPDARAEYVSAVTRLRVCVLANACETFHAPGVHEAEAAHHVGLWLMASRGAQLVRAWVP